MITKPDDAYGFIYMTTNNINGKKYIGQKTFTRDWRTYLGSGSLLNKAIKLYGAENFSRKIICFCKNRKELNEKEIYYIDKFNAIKNPDFYNLARGGNNIDGFKCWRKLSFKQQEDLREIYRKRSLGKGNPFYGKHHSEQTKEILRQKSRSRSFGKNNSFYGHHHRDESKKIIAEKAKLRYSGKNNPFYGKHHSEETKLKLGLKAKPVGQYDMELNLVNVFNSTKKAAQITGISLTGIRQCVIGANKTSGNYIWKYIEKGI